MAETAGGHVRLVLDGAGLAAAQHHLGRRSAQTRLSQVHRVLGPVVSNTSRLSHHPTQNNCHEVGTVGNYVETVKKLTPALHIKGTLTFTYDKIIRSFWICISLLAFCVRLD